MFAQMNFMLQLLEHWNISYDFTIKQMFTYLL